MHFFKMSQGKKTYWLKLYSLIIAVCLHIFNGQIVLVFSSKDLSCFHKISLSIPSNSTAKSIEQQWLSVTHVVMGESLNSHSINYCHHYRRYHHLHMDVIIMSVAITTYKHRHHMFIYIYMALFMFVYLSIWYITLVLSFFPVCN